MIECGDIVDTGLGIILVEKIDKDGFLIGHELKKNIVRTFCRNPKVLCSDFRYKQESQMVKKE